jgi:hypothetical protein
LAFVGTFVIQDYFEEGRPGKDFVLSDGAIAAFVLYFVWFYARTKKLYTNWPAFFGISILFAFIGEMTMGYGQVETVMAGKYLEFVAVIFHYLVLATVVFYLNLAVTNSRLYYLLVFIITPVLMFGFGLRQPDLMLYGITFVPTHLVCIGIGVIFYALLFFVDFVPDIIKGTWQTPEGKNLN